VQISENKHKGRQWTTQSTIHRKGACEEQIRVQVLNILTYLSQAQSTGIDPENQNQISPQLLQ